MATTSQYLSFFLSFFTTFLFLCVIIPISFSQPLSDGDSEHPTEFIVHMEKSQKPTLFTSHHHWYNSIIKSLPPSNHVSKILYTYEKVVNGFAASLTPSQAAKLKDISGVLLVSPNQVHKIQTTRTPQFLKLSSVSGLLVSGNYGEGMIIGVVDTGIWPEHPSFSDANISSPAPPTWKGKCETWPDFPASSCNGKLIGARAFLSKPAMTKSPRDTEGHGTHVASTIAGSVVPNASFYEYAKGTAVGIAPKARIAVYKVCGIKGCEVVDVLAGMDRAVADGVDIISMSLSGGTREYSQDDMAIASFGAMQHGVLVSVSAGNSGPSPKTVNHTSPWVLTVGASSIDREFRTKVVLGDSRTFVGSSLYAGTHLPNKQYPLAFAGDFGNRYCQFLKFNNPSQLAGKIILCDGRGNISVFEMDVAVKNVSGVGLIVPNTIHMGEELQAHPYMNPGVRVNYKDGEKIEQYIRMNQHPTATCEFLGTIAGKLTPPAPKVAAFSARGPNRRTPQILKPDVIAPGLNIIAGWSLATGPWGEGLYDKRRVSFNIISGTSMACPHVSGIAALLKRAYPKWSPAAIKSAIMTTSYVVDNYGQSIKDLWTGGDSTPFAHGSGHVDPNRALDPGLVYDMGEDDYIGFLCSIGYSYVQIKLVSRKRVAPNVCDQTYIVLGAKVKPGDLNLPSFAIVFTKDVETVKYRRIVTNVGSNVDATYYVANWFMPDGITFDITPRNLVFDVNNQKQKYEVTFSSIGGYGVAARFGWFEWSDGTHRVRSVIAFSWVNTPFALDSVASI